MFYITNVFRPDCWVNKERKNTKLSSEGRQFWNLCDSNDEALCCQLMHIASDSLEIAKSSLKLLDLARFR